MRSPLSSSGICKIHNGTASHSFGICILNIRYPSVHRKVRPDGFD